MLWALIAKKLIGRVIWIFLTSISSRSNHNH